MTYIAPYYFPDIFSYIKNMPAWMRRRARKLLDVNTARFLETSDRWSEARIRTYQHVALEKLYRHARSNISFYKNLYRMSEKRCDPGTFFLLPSVSKELLRKYDSKYYIDEDMLFRAEWETTSGSSGQPFKFAFDKATHVLLAGLWHRFMENHAVVNARKLLIADPGLRRISDYDFRISIFDLFRNSDEAIVKLKDSFADVIIGYASGLVEAGYLVQKLNVPIGVKKVFSFGEMLPEAHRNFLERTFGCEVFGFYGASEFGIIGQECQFKNGFHINEEAVYVEIEGRNGLDGSGEILITALTNYVMPLIRYRIGDSGSIISEPCPCGRMSRRIFVHGRTSFVLRKGTLAIHQFEFNNILQRHYRYVRQFRVIPLPEGVRLEIVSEKIDESQDGFILDSMETLLGKDAKIDIVHISSVAPATMGKADVFVKSF